MLTLTHLCWHSHKLQQILEPDSTRFLINFHMWAKSPFDFASCSSAIIFFFYQVLKRKSSGILYSVFYGKKGEKSQLDNTYLFQPIVSLVFSFFQKLFSDSHQFSLFFYKQYYDSMLLSQTPKRMSIIELTLLGDQGYQKLSFRLAW